MSPDANRAEACLPVDGLQSERKNVPIQLRAHSMLVGVQRFHGEPAAVHGPEPRDGRRGFAVQFHHPTADLRSVPQQHDSRHVRSHAEHFVLALVPGDSSPTQLADGKKHFLLDSSF